MKPAWRNNPAWWRPALLGLLATIGRLYGALPAPPEEPRWLTLQPDLFTLWPPPGANAIEYTRLDVEAERETRRSAGGGPNTTIERLLVAPSLGLGARGSIYHPNLFHFDARGEIGYGWQNISSDTGGRRVSTEDSTTLDRYNITAILLRSKPYAATFLADRTHTFRDLDFFNRVTVDTAGYGGQWGYTAGPVPVRFSVRHQTEDQYDVSLASHLEQLTADMRAESERHGADRSDFFYNYGDYDRRTSRQFADRGTYHYASLYDQEHFGTGERVVLNSAMAYNKVDSANLPSDNFTATETFLAHHTRTLASLYDYSFSAYSAPSVESQSHFARAGLQHQLFESLSTSLDVHGSTVGTDSSGGSQDQRRYGFSLGASYTKRLADWGRLTIGESVRLDQEHRSVSGGTLTVPNERHTLASGETLLNQPNVTAILRVSDTNNIVNYQLGVDFETNQIGSLIQIRRLPAAPLLTNDSASLFVTYVVDLAPGQGNGSFDTFADQFSVRLDLFQGLLDFYTRLNWIENYGGHQFILENTFTTQSGGDVSWRWLRGGASYETRDSTFIKYQSVNVYESFFFMPADFSTLNVDLRQRWADYPDQHRQVADYSFLLRDYLRIGRYLGCVVEGGVRWERGAGIDQRQAVARTELDFAFGKLKTVLGYQFNNDDVRGDLREKHFVYLKAKRAF